MHLYYDKHKQHGRTFAWAHNIGKAVAKEKEYRKKELSDLLLNNHRNKPCLKLKVEFAFENVY